MRKVTYAAGYRPKKGCKIPAEVALKAIMEVKRPGQGAQPEDVLDAAKDPSHVLHDVFEWDDNEAARQHRLAQARNLISSIRVVITNEDRQDLEFRAFVNLEDHGGYLTTAEVGSDADLLDKAVALAQRDVDSAQARLRQFEGLTEVSELLAQASEGLRKRRGRDRK
jgi:hypothetical protein